MNLNELVLQIGTNAIVQPNKYLQPGHNGPYRDPETSLRNFGHWLITFSKCYEWTGDNRFKDKVVELAEHLCSEKSRPYGYSFHHRNKTGKDKCNGLIGQAWTFEALGEASKVLEARRFEKLAEDVFFQHPFDRRIGLWNRLEIDGQVLSFDSTFNHQLWFAACSSLIHSEEKEEIRRRITRFLDCLKHNLSVLKNGLVYHPIEHLFDANMQRQHRVSNQVKKWFMHILSAVRTGIWPKEAKTYEQAKTEIREKLVSKSIGYHCFNMYAFALLKQSIPTHPFWNSERFTNMIDYMLTEEYKNGLDDSPFGYPYNSPGFEVPYAMSVLKVMPKETMRKTCTWWVNEQLKRCYNDQTRFMENNTEDPITHTARIYEVVRLDHSLLRSIRVL